MTKAKAKALTAKKDATITIKVGVALGAQESFQKLSLIEKKPKAALKIALYVKKELEPLWQVIEDRRVAYVKQFSSEKNPEISFEKDPENFNKFIEAYGDYLAEDTELPVLDMTMDELIESFGEEESQKISERTLIVVMPFLKD